MANVNNSAAAVFNMLATIKFLRIMDDVICAIFLALNTIPAEIVIGKSVMHMSEKGSSSKRGMLIMRRKIFQLQSFIARV